jgi:nicotinamide-nucleotide amidase
LNKGLVAFFSIAALSIAIAAFPAAKNYRAFASEAADESKAVVIIADYLDIEDIGKMENLYRLTGDSGSAEKPVGLCYVGIAIEDSAKVKKFIFNGNRKKIKWNSSSRALDFLRRELLSL